MALTILQSVDTMAEKLALEIATAWDAQGQSEAVNLYNQKRLAHNLTYGEASALAHIVSCMVHGRKWKKNS